MKFDHIGIVVSDLADGRTMLRAAFGIRAWTDEFRDKEIGVSVQFGRDASGTCYEIVAPLTDRSPVSRVLAERVNVIHHLAYLVADLDGEAKRLRDEGFIVIGPPKRAVAYSGSRIQFFVSETQMIFELIEAPAHVHQYAELEQSDFVRAQRKLRRGSST